MQVLRTPSWVRSSAAKMHQEPASFSSEDVRYPQQRVQTKCDMSTSLAMALDVIDSININLRSTEKNKNGIYKLLRIHKCQGSHTFVSWFLCCKNAPRILFVFFGRYSISTAVSSDQARRFDIAVDGVECDLHSTNINLTSAPHRKTKMEFRTSHL